MTMNRININKYKNISQLKKNVFSGSILSAVDILITMVSYPIYLKYLGTEKYGLWSVVSVVFSFSQLGLLCIGTAVVKYVASCFGKKDFNLITEYVTNAFYILMVPSLIIVSILIFFKAAIFNFIGIKDSFVVEGESLIFYVGLLSIFTFFVEIIKSVVVGIGRADLTNGVFLLGRIFQIILSVYLLIMGAGVWSLYFGFLLYYIIPAIFFPFTLKYTYHINIFNPFFFKKQRIKELINVGGLLTVATLASMFVVPFNKIIISKYIGLSEVTYYHIANQIIMSVRGLYVRGLAAILPKFSELTTKTVESIIPIHKKAMKFILVCAIPLFLSLFLLSNTILKIWLGAQFDTQITLILRILIIGWFINALTVPDYFMFIGIGKTKYSVSEVCLKCITNIAFILCLLYLNIQFTLIKIVIIDSVSLIIGAIFLKYKYFEYTKFKGVLCFKNIKLR